MVSSDSTLGKLHTQQTQRRELAHSSKCPQFDSGPGLIPGSRIMMRHVKYILLLEWSTTSQRLHGCIGFLSPMHKKIPDSYSKREGGNPGNSGLSSQQEQLC